MSKITITKKKKSSPKKKDENNDQNDNISDITTDSQQIVSSTEIIGTHNIPYYLKYSCIIIFNSVRLCIKLSGVYLLWIILHFGASHLYIQFCVPSTFVGFIISPFMTASPHCQGLRWIIYNGANTINNMWVILGTWICSYLIQFRNGNEEPS